MRSLEMPVLPFSMALRVAGLTAEQAGDLAQRQPAGCGGSRTEVGPGRRGAPGGSLVWLMASGYLNSDGGELPGSGVDDCAWVWQCEGRHI